MPLPLIAVAIALIAAGGGGVTAGAIGAIDMAEAKKVAGRSRERYEAALAGHAKHEKNTGDHLASYGRRQIEVQTTTLAAWVSWLEANERKIKRLDRTGSRSPDLTFRPCANWSTRASSSRAGSAPLCRLWWPNRRR